MFSDKLQIEIRSTGNSNREFAKLAGIVKKELDSILGGEIPGNWTMQKLSKALCIDIEEIESWLDASPAKKEVSKISKNFVPANLKKKQKSPLKAGERHCIRCFFREKKYCYDNVQMAHYTGIMQHALDKAKGQKVSDILKTPFCKPCHDYFDIETERKSIEKSEEFLFYIALFISQEFEKGNIVIKKGE